MASQTQDDGFHEIQLNGKQLVFVFMAATLVSVVIFLCGVLVGRGVQRERGSLGSMEALNSPTATAPGLDPTKSVVPPTVQPGTDPTKVPAPAGDEAPSSGRSRASASDSVRAESKAQTPAAIPTGGKPAPTVASSPTPTASDPVQAASTPRARSEAEAKPTATTGDGPDSGWVVQVASVDQSGEADAIVRRFRSKDYDAFVLSGGPNRFRVRVRGFKNRAEADAAAARLRKEERIEPWVTR